MTYLVNDDDLGERLDVYLSDQTDHTRSRIGNLIRDGRVMVNGRAEKKPGYALRAGDEIELQVPEAQKSEAFAQDIELEIVYQDQDLAVVFKPSGMVVHPAAGNPDGTMVNALLYHLKDLSGIGGVLRPGVVHRIDKDTSGLLLVAKNDRSHVMLSEQLKAHSVKRAYWAIVQGRLKQMQGSISAPIGRHPKDRKRMAIVEGGREAVTHFRVLEELRGATWIEASLETGRTHQIRVHMASLNHPVLGDPLYGPKKPPFKVEGGQLLHAKKLGFIHPTTGEEMVFTHEPEPRFDHWLRALKL